MAESQDGDVLDASGSITILYQQWRRQGESTALGQLIDRFRPRLLALARSTLQGRLPAMADAEDALQSAMISFWEQVEGGDLKEDADRDDLWNVLGLITVRKALRLQRRERARKRGSGIVVAGLPIDQAAGCDVDPGLDLLCSEMIELLDSDLRSFALLRLMGHKNREIAQEMQCTERKVERKLQLIRAVWEDEVRRWQD